MVFADGPNPASGGIAGAKVDAGLSFDAGCGAGEIVCGGGGGGSVEGVEPSSR